MTSPDPRDMGRGVRQSQSRSSGGGGGKSGRRLNHVRRACPLRLSPSMEDPGHHRAGALPGDWRSGPRRSSHHRQHPGHRGRARAASGGGSGGDVRRLSAGRHLLLPGLGGVGSAIHLLDARGAGPRQGGFRGRSDHLATGCSSGDRRPFDLRRFAPRDGADPIEGRSAFRHSGLSENSRRAGGWPIAAERHR